MRRFPRSFSNILVVVTAACAVLVALALPAQAEFVQQGPKLVGTGAVGSALQGSSVALSADGNTAIVGGGLDDSYTGAAWIFTRIDGVWTQQGSKLVGTGAVGKARQGSSVALSADGNTAIVGGDFDDGELGAAWVFTRNAGAWTQQGSKLVGTGTVGYAGQGISVALAADGNTAIVGGFKDNSYAGATWVFTRNAGVWAQQGSKLVGAGAAGNAAQGISVALSADGNTAFVGGGLDNSSAGAAWVFTRAAGVWTQQGSKLVGTGAGGGALQGSSVALSADGNTAIIGGSYDNSLAGAAWVFTHTAGTWTQQGSKLVGTGAIGGADQGTSVALSADGNTAIIGGFRDNSYSGAVWVFTRAVGVWTQQGLKLVGTGAVGNARQGLSAALSADGNTALIGGPNDSDFGAAWVFNRGASPKGVAHDFDGNGKSDILWRHSAGSVAGWLMNGTTISTSTGIGAADPSWQIVGQGDFDGDGRSDVLWRHSGGSVAMWLMNGTTISTSTGIGAADLAWSVVGVGDFNGDGKSDILWRHSGGSVAVWLMNGTTISTSTGVGAADIAWSVARIGDINGDGKSDVLWRHTGGSVAAWLMNGTTIATSTGIGAADPNWTIARTGDFNGDGKSDILWRHTGGSVAVWLMNGTTIATSTGVGAADLAWTIASSGDFDGDGKSDVLWRHSGGSVAMWLMNGTTISTSTGVGAADPSWVIQGVNTD